MLPLKCPLSDNWIKYLKWPEMTLDNICYTITADCLLELYLNYSLLLYNGEYFIIKVNCQGSWNKRKTTQIRQVLFETFCSSTTNTCIWKGRRGGEIRFAIKLILEMSFHQELDSLSVLWSSVHIATRNTQRDDIINSVVAFSSLKSNRNP